MVASNALRRIASCAGAVPGGAMKERWNTCWLRISSQHFAGVSSFTYFMMCGTPSLVSSSCGSIASWMRTFTTLSRTQPGFCDFRLAQSKPQNPSISPRSSASERSVVPL